MNERLAATGIARPAAGPVPSARPGALVGQTVRVHEAGIGRDREAFCEIDRGGIRITDARSSRAIAWPDARSISVDGGRVRIVSPAGQVSLAIVLDGIGEPGLATVFARVLEEGRAGELVAHAGALHELALGVDPALAEFAEAPDPGVPLALGAFAAFGGVVLVPPIPGAL